MACGGTGRLRPCGGGRGPVPGPGAQGTRLHSGGRQRIPRSGQNTGRPPAQSPPAGPLRPGVPPDGRLRRGLQLPRVPALRGAVRAPRHRDQPHFRGLPLRNRDLTAGGRPHREVRPPDHPAGRDRADGPGPGSDPDAGPPPDPGRAPAVHRRILRGAQHRGGLDRRNSHHRPGAGGFALQPGLLPWVQCHRAGPAAWFSSLSAGPPWR